jgi:hypothetical protein
LLSFTRRYESAYQYEREILRRLAFVLRYTSCGLIEAAEMETRLLMILADEVSQIIREENKARSKGAG